MCTNEIIGPNKNDIPARGDRMKVSYDIIIIYSAPNPSTHTLQHSSNSIFYDEYCDIVLIVVCIFNIFFCKLCSDTILWWVIGNRRYCIYIVKVPPGWCLRALGYRRLAIEVRRSPRISAKSLTFQITLQYSPSIMTLWRQPYSVAFSIYQFVANFNNNNIIQIQIHRW